MRWRRHGCRRPASRSRGTLPGTCSAGAARRECGPARTSTRFRTAAGTTARSACSRGSRRRSEPGGTARGRRLPCRGDGPDGEQGAHGIAGRVRRAAHRAGAGARARAASRSASSRRSPGQARGEVVFEGRADHAGTTPMDVRDDALVEAARVRPARHRVPPRRRSRDGRSLQVEPNAMNVVPARVTVAVDARAPTSPSSSTSSSPRSASSRRRASSRWR